MADLLGQDGRREDGNPIHGSPFRRTHAIDLVSPLGHLNWTYRHGRVHDRYPTNRHRWNSVLRWSRSWCSPAREGFEADGF